MDNPKIILEGFFNLLTGKKTPESTKRIKICTTCIFLKKRDNTCKKCGCYMPAKVKAEAAKCPVGKW